MCQGCFYEEYPCPIAFIALEFSDEITENIENILFDKKRCQMFKFVLDTEKKIKDIEEKKFKTQLELFKR